VKECDFDDAVLADCRFIGCDLEGTRLPPWPCFTLLDPVARLRELLAQPWPGDAAEVVQALRWSPASTAGVAFDAKSLAAEYSVEVDGLRRLLEQVPNVAM